MSKRDLKPMVSEDDPQWMRFWNAYPRRVGKKEARIAWQQIGPTSAQVDQMVTALSWQCQQLAWTKDGGIYVPHPSSYLRAERWTDEAPTQLQTATPMTSVIRRNAEAFAELTGRKRIV